MDGDLIEDLHPGELVNNKMNSPSGQSQEFFGYCSIGLLVILLSNFSTKKLEHRNMVKENQGKNLQYPII
jgi:hypothetical protein